MRVSEIKNRMLSGRAAVGTWISIGHPDVTEMLAHQGFDFLVFDLEHAPLTIESANDRTVVAIQIETGDAVERIDQILSVPGVDAALLGLGDLSASLGCHLEFAAPRVVAAVETVLAACRRHDVLPGMAYAHDAVTARASIEQGFRLVAVGSDDLFLLDGSRRVLDGLRSLR